MPPAPGMMPRVTSGNPTTASNVAMRVSQPSAKLEFAAQRRAGNGGNDGLFARFNGGNDGRQLRVARRLSEFANVGAGDEGLAGADENDGSNRPVTGERTNRCEKSGAHRERAGIDRRIIDDHKGDIRLTLDAYRLIGNGVRHVLSVPTSASNADQQVAAGFRSRSIQVTVRTKSPARHLMRHALPKRSSGRSKASVRMTSIDRFCLWLEATSLSQAIQSTAWIVPAVQTIHILAIAMLAGSVLMLNLRLIRVVGIDQPLDRFSSRFLPVIWWALPILLITGAIMIIGEPARALKNPFFQLKMALLLAALGVTTLYQFLLARGGAHFEPAKSGRGAALLIAVPSLALWTAIVFAGRWIAYY